MSPPPWEMSLRKESTSLKLWGVRDRGPPGIVEAADLSTRDIFTDELPSIVEVQR
jgi:hypothetical protein